MNKKGFTLIELITTFALATVLIIILINVVVLIKDIYNQNNIKSKLAIEQSTLSKLMNKEFNKGLKYYSPCAEGIFCYEFRFKDDSSSKLIVYNNKIKFNEYVYKLDKGVEVKNPSVNRQYVDIYDETNKDNFFTVKIPIYSKLYPNTNFGIDLTVVGPENNILLLPESVSFAEDPWEVIAENVIAGNLNKYNVGDEKEVALTGFTNLEEGSNGLYTVRIANMSTPEECNTEGFSQTACGFVVEFVDIITRQEMDSNSHNAGGWPASSMRTYVNKEIYNSLPKALQNNIKNTDVVSGHEAGQTENYKTIDKIYLLSLKEVWKTKANDTLEETRQLDYYQINGVTATKYSGAIKKFNGNNWSWWLRSPHSLNRSDFYYVSSIGDHVDNGAGVSTGVAPAFKL